MLRGSTPLIVAIVLGAVAGIIAYSTLQAQLKAARQGWNIRHVLCASRDLDEGSELGDGMVAVCEIPEQFVTDSFIESSDATDPSVAIPYGERLIIPLRKGDAILVSQFETTQDPSASRAIPARARAISVQVQERGSVNQLIRPGDHVDVVATFRTQDGKELIAKTILQNVIVLATGHATGTNPLRNGDDRAYQHVALLVLPQEVEEIVLAEEIGTISLSLRHDTDLDVVAPDDLGTTVSTLFNGERGSVLRKQRYIRFQPPSVVEKCEGNNCHPEEEIPSAPRATPYR
jgi:pilus assembly protein CpaB